MDAVEPAPGWHTISMLDVRRDRELPIILLIDDDLVSREVMATVLIMGGFLVHTAADGAESLEMVGSGKCVPGLILMDAQMPGLSGIALVAALRTSSRAFIVAISASNPPAEVAAACDGFLQKPFGAGEVKNLLEKREPEPPLPAAEDKSSPEPDAPHASDPNTPVVSAETLAQLRQMMPEAAVRQIYAAVVADLARRQTDLEAAIAKADNAAVRRIGHAIKGGCAIAGAVEAARLGAAIEDGALDAGNQVNNNQRLLNDLSAAARNLERMLEAEFPAQAAGLGG